MKILLLLLMAACLGVIGYVFSQGSNDVYEFGGMAIEGTRLLIGAGLTLAGSAVVFAGLTFVSMLKLAAWIGGALIVSGILTGVIGGS